MMPLIQMATGVPNYLEPSVRMITEDGIQVFSSFSPNGDDMNDVFVIKGLENVENTVKIYNRWGAQVYETKNYGSIDNFFRGISEGRFTVRQSDKLPSGTYYYVIEYLDDNNEIKKKTGFVYING